MNIQQTLSAAAIIACGSTAFAGPVVELGPSQLTSGMSGIMNTQFSELIGTVESDKYIDFSIYANAGGRGDSALYEGTLMTRVVRSNETGDLHFNYRIMNANEQLSGMVSHIELDGFAGFQTRVEYRNELTSPGVEGPSDANRSADGDMLTYSFDNLLNTSDDSRFFFAMVDTDTYYEDSTTATIYLENGESVSLVVDGAVPAPGALGLLSAAGLMTIRRRR